MFDSKLTQHKSKLPELLLPDLPSINPLSFSTQSCTSRSSKFIPQEFRNKHLNQSPLKKLYPLKTHKKSLEIITTPFKKKLHLQDFKYALQSSSHKNIQQNNRAGFNRTQKKLTTFTNGSSFPKLRQTNSTQCQSPKAMSSLQYSKFNEFKVIRKLGQGRFGEVYLVKHNQTGFISALKVINKASLACQSPEETQKSLNQLVSEIKIQFFLNHPNIISIYDCFNDEQNMYLLMELATDGHLFSVTSRGQCFSEQVTSIIVREVTEGVKQMHKNSIIHRDIKLENIVLSMGMAKICDFGWSAYCPKEFRSTLCGTPLYLSPEMLIGKAYNRKVDIWAIGSIAHELATAKDPFQIKSSDDLSKIITDDFEMQVGSPELRSFINFILRKNPLKRPDAETVLMHPFIEKYRDLETSEELCRIRWKKQENS